MHLRVRMATELGSLGNSGGKIGSWGLRSSKWVSMYSAVYACTSMASNALSWNNTLVTCFCTSSPKKAKERLSHAVTLPSNGAGNLAGE